jgi:hypothetical protein
MKKFKKFLILAAILPLTLGGFSSCATSAKTNVSAKLENVTVAAKDFNALGLLFVEVVVKDGNGEAIIYEALLKEADRKGADTIVNVTIGRKKGGPKFLSNEKTWYGSATAIKYTSSLSGNASVSNDKSLMSGDDK